jgi:predicted polyphosphate/ATP-dependent NAD kinase
MRIGLIVNPIAGMGGRVGLKGTDGEEILREAREMGAEPRSPKRAIETLEGLHGVKKNIHWLTWSEEMGEKILDDLDFDYSVIGEVVGNRSTADDTKRAAKEMERREVELILFVGGDGTASDVVEAVDMRVPIIGVPAGVKMFSAVFASTPRAASHLVLRFLEGGVELVEREVMDIDEDAYRLGRLSASLKGYARVPYISEIVLNGKSAVSIVDENIMKEAIATRVVEEMRPGATYFLGPGSTVAKVAELLGVKKTILGIDVIKDGEHVLRDANEKELLNVVGDDTWIVLSPLGGQGSILGRGNQPLSPRVLHRVSFDRIIIIATTVKLAELKAITVDTGDPKLDEELRGFRRVKVGYHEEKVMRVI